MSGVSLCVFYSVTTVEVTRGINLKYHKNIIISAHFPPKAPLARLGRDDYNKKRDIYKRDLA